METSSSLPLQENRSRHLLRVLRPLFWWIILVLVLYGIRTHQRLMAQTRLNFSVTLQGLPVEYEANSLLDGQRINNGERISLGRHAFTISHPKTESFSTNLFTWYGGHHFGEIALRRAKGMLTVQSVPPAKTLTISGPEFAVTLTNSPGMTSSVPTDNYLVEANYAHWRETRQIPVASGASANWHFTPRLGTAQLRCNQPEATFELLRSDQQTIEEGKFPVTINELPAGSYTLHAWHHENRRNERLTVTADATNSVDVKFLYGSAVIRTDPAGTDVTSSDGRYFGATPLRISELQAGTWKFTLRQRGYETTTVSLEIAADQTATLHTNLINSSFVQDMQKARQYMAELDYDRALYALSDALSIRPDDLEANALHKEAAGRRSLRLAEALGKGGDYVGGIKELESALVALPENEDAKKLLAEYKAHAPEQIERLRQERLERPKKAFDSIAGRYKDSDFFETHELKTSKPGNEVRPAIFKALRDVQPAFITIPYNDPAPEIFAWEAKQEFPGGMRRCFIVGGQTRDDETQILFKVLEYKAHRSMSIEGGLRFSIDYIPVHPSRIPEMTDKLKAQVQEGIRLATERIQQAIGQTMPDKQ